MYVATQYQQVLNEVHECARACGRTPESVKLIAVSKTVGMPEISDAFAAGALDFGENRPDCIAEKEPQLLQANWHFIGNVQSRAIPTIVKHSCLIHSLYKESHLPVIERAASEFGKVQDVLIEVNVSGEASKGGVTPEALPELIEQAQRYPHIRVRGLMTMAPQGSTELARECFEGLAALHARIKAQMNAQEAADFTELSMGMSEDWQVAIPAGATMVRVGRAIFSEGFAGNKREMGK